MPGSIEKFDRNREIVEMLGNHTMQEVANQYNISRQAVQMIEKRYKKKYGNITENSRGASAIIYPVIRQHLLDNRISISQFCKNIGSYSGTDGSICRFLYGKNDKVSINVINEILKILGKKYEEVFLID